jgi:predicted dehydrogenase
MMKLRDASRLPVAIGFQDLFDPAVRAVKARLLCGAIGNVSHASLIASWPRTHDYFGRSTWAGALKRGDTWVLDSPANNAISHFLNLALFLLGPTQATSADITRVEAELYRANNIQNYDTCALRLTTAAGATLLVYFTHASDEFLHPTITLTGTSGSFKFINDTSITLTPSHRPSESFPVNRPLSRHVIEQFVAYVRGQSANIATIENAAVHAKVISAVSQAAAVHTITPSHTRIVQLPGTSQQMTSVPGLLPALSIALSHRMLLHEAANAGHLSLPWTHAAGWLDTAQYTHFSGPKVG